MFLSERAQQLIKCFRDEKNGGVDNYKASVSDTMSIIISMHDVHANTDRERKALIDALSVLAEYNELLTELSKDK